MEGTMFPPEGIPILREGTARMVANPVTKGCNSYCTCERNLVYWNNYLIEL